MARVVGVETIDLGALGVADLLALVDGAATAEALHRRTGGHPFFIAEIAGASGRAGHDIDPDAVPDAVREWIAHRLDALDGRLRARLHLAAVLGPDLSVSTLAACAQADEDEVLDDLEALVEEGFLAEGAAIGEFAFSHLITEETVYQRLGAARRARLHAAAAEALAPGSSAAAARHYRAAGPAFAADAAAHSLAAGREALESGAWALADELLRAASASAPDDPSVAARSLVGLARSLHHRGRRDEAEDAIERAIALARAHGLGPELAEAVLALVGRAGRGIARSLTDAGQADLIREALEALDLDGAGPDDRERQWLACELEIELALAQYFSASPAQRHRLTARAVDRARGLHPPDPRLMARAVLGSRVSKLDPAQLRERLADLDGLLALPAADRSAESTLAAHVYRHEDLLRLGRRPQARAALDAAAELLARHPHRYWGWAAATWEGLDALIGGDLDRAERLAVEAAGRQGAGGDDPDGGEAGALACLGVNLVNIRLYQRRAGEVVEPLARAADDHPEIPCYRAVLALCAAEAGEDRIAREAYGHFRSADFSSIPDDPNRLLALAVLADAAVLLDDPGAAPRLRALLEPYDGQHVLLCCYGGGGAYWGPVAHHLGALARLGDDDEAADALLDRAAAAAAAFDSPPALDRLAAGLPAR
jgi:tetratricopeptide (TPR) repeat protein